jgi:hypothetical protein
MVTPIEAAMLRQEFPPAAVGKLPKGGTELDYVGHAAVTDRLLAVDPEWSWEPFAVAADGGPLVRLVGADAELWIRLTVCGKTLPAVGTASAKSFELSKQLVSDALRNGAMRFGVALDLWAKEDLHDIQNQPPPAPVVSAEEARRIADRVNAAGPAGRDAWIKRFMVRPAALPSALLADADEWLLENTPPVPPVEGNPK